MKRILLLLFSLITTAAIGQYPINQILSSDSTMVSVGRNATGGIRGGLVNMVFADTTAANLSRISYYTGAQIWTTTDSAIWVRFKGTPSFWVKMAGASGGTTGSFWNITGNYFGGGVPLNYGVGTNSYDYLPLKTNNITRLLIPPDGILRSSAPANKYLMMDTTTLEMYYGDGGGGSGWSLTGNTGIDTTNFIGTIDSVPFIIRTHNQFSGTVGSYITGYDNSVITTGNFPYRHGLISLGIGAAKSLPLNNTGGIVVIGTDALKNLHNSSVSNNYAANGLVVIGTNAYKYLDSSFYPYGNRSTVIGHWAGHRNFAGEYNTIVGAMNMELNYRGSNNTSVGFSTLRSNIDGGGNVAVGLFSMLYNTTGIDTIPLISGGSGYTYANVTISAPLAGSPGGYVQTATATADVSSGAVTAIRMTNKGAGYSIYPHTYDFGTQGNIVITITGDGTGAIAGTPTMISGSNNTSLGTSSGFYNLRGVGNVNVGVSSSNKSDDNYTTLVGYNSVTNSVTGKISNATAIGYNSKVAASNSLVLGGTGVDTVNVGIGTDKPLARLHIASGNIVAEGTTEAYPSTHYLPFNGIGSRFMWVNSKRALRAGYVTDNKWDIDSIAHGSVAFGYYTGAMGYGSLAQGEYAYARGKAALAVGWQVDANADFSVALGSGNKCYGSWSTSFGLNNIANSHISLATGYGTIAYYGATTFGYLTRGKGYYSLASGDGTYTKNYGSAAFGVYNDTTDVGSVSAIDNANRIFVVGNGTADNARSNALTILQTGKVGIGTTSPDSLLTVSQGIYGQRGLRLPNLPTGKKAKQLYWDTDGTVYVADSTVGGGGGGGGLTIGTTTIANSATGSILYDSSGILSRNADLYWDVSNKRLGIGTSTPATKFHTVGTVRHQTLGTAITDTTTYKPLVINSSGDVLPSTYWYGGGGGGWSLTGNAGTNPASNFIGTTDGQPLMFRYNNQNAGSIGKEGMHTYLGIEAGENDVSGGDPNIGIGSYVLSSNTTGDGNSAVGGFALGINTTGYYNSAVGVSALYSNTTGYYNSAVGVSAFYGNTTGYYNSAVGASALGSNTTGYYNSAVGASAGWNIKQKPDAKYQNLFGANTYGTRDSITVLGADFIKETIVRGKLIDSTLSAGSGTKAVRWNSSTGEFTYADTTAGGGMVYPAAGIANSTGSAWGTSYSTTGTGTVVALSASPSLTGNVGIAQGTITTDAKALDISTTWNAAGVAFTGLKLDVTNTASAATSKMIAVTQGLGAGFWVDKNGQTEILTNSGAVGYGSQGLKLRDYSSGASVVLQTTALGSLYITDAAGTATSLTLGTRANPADGTTFTAGSGRWIINSGGFVVNRSTWLGTTQNEVLSTSLPQYGGFYDASNYFTIGAGSTGAVAINAVGSGSAFNFADRVSNSQGADVASAAGAISLGTGGNLFEITGTSSITLISNVGWQNGSEVTLMFTSTATLVNGTATSGTDVTMLLAGAANFTATADDVITLVYGEIGGTVAWREKSRSVN